jgi:hypothetical protein
MVRKPLVVAALGISLVIPLAMLHATEGNRAAAPPAASKTEPASKTRAAPAAADQNSQDQVQNPATLDQSEFEGEWEGENDSVKVEVTFPKLSERQQVLWKVHQKQVVIAADMSLVIEPGGKAATFVFRKGLEFEAVQGRVARGAWNSFLLEIIPNPRLKDPGYPAVKGLVLRPRSPREPQHGTKLAAEIEDRLQWGEPANGLRAALIRPPALGEPDPGEYMDFKLIVQNVSAEAIQFRRAGDTRTRLLLCLNGRPVSATVENDPTPVAFLLKPGDAGVMRLFSHRNEGPTLTSEPALTCSAEVTVESAPAGVWSGKLGTAEFTAGFTAHGLVPKDKSAHALFTIWNAASRSNAKIPGALIGQLAEGILTFTKNNPTHETTPRFLEMLRRLDPARDWTGAEGLALLDDVAALQTIPIGLALDRENLHTLHTGSPLPAVLAKAPWGAPHANGLRLAWVLEPRTREHRLGTALQARILIHNSGKTPVIFRTQTFQQPNHQAFTHQGGQLQVDSTHWLTLGRLLPYRLAPGEYVELHCPGLGIGADQNHEDWQGVRAGSWIHADAGDDVSVSTDPIALHGANEGPPDEGEPGWWLAFIKDRLARHNPLPDDPEERKRLLYRVSMELFGNPVKEAEYAAFAGDQQPDALESLAVRLAHWKWVTAYSGELDSAMTKFRVLPADPDAAKRPRVVKGPGWYTLGDQIRLSVSRRADEERIFNEAYIQFFARDVKQPPPGPIYYLKLPEGYETWAAGWQRGGTVLWLNEKDGVRRIDFSDPTSVKDEPAKEGEAPADVREALRAALHVK